MSHVTFCIFAVLFFDIYIHFYTLYLNIYTFYTSLHLYTFTPFTPLHLYTSTPLHLHYTQSCSCSCIYIGTGSLYFAFAGTEILLQRQNEPVVLMLIDVRRAHFYSTARRKVFVELPAEACTVNWEFAICQVMIAIGSVQGRATPCIYRHLEKQLRVRVHGDDFVLLG